MTTLSTVSPTSSTEVTTSAGDGSDGRAGAGHRLRPGVHRADRFRTRRGSYVNRVAELRAAGQVPDERVRRAHGVVVRDLQLADEHDRAVRGPFNGPYDGCDARLKAAPRLVHQGHDPETSHDFISCLCPTSAATLPPLTAINQTGVWVGELQRVLGNKLNYDIPDLGDQTWGVLHRRHIRRGRAVPDGERAAGDRHGRRGDLAGDPGQGLRVSCRLDEVTNRHVGQNGGSSGRSYGLRRGRVAAVAVPVSAGGFGSYPSICR